MTIEPRPASKRKVNSSENPEECRLQTRDVGRTKKPLPLERWILTPVADTTPCTDARKRPEMQQAWRPG
eukprot:6105442-Alexandrium_andersonii.AAC.1